MTEIVTMKFRGKCIIWLNAMQSVGSLFAWALAYSFLDSYVKGNWKLFIIISSLPNLLIPIFCIAILHESPRVLLIKDKFDDAMIVLNKIGKLNNK